MTQPIRILHVIGVLNRGGAENMIMNLYRAVDRTKIQFDFVQNKGEKAAFEDEITSLGGRIFRCPRYNGKNHFAYKKWWKNFFKEHKGEYPVVHGHIGSSAAVYLSVAKKNGAFTVAHSHSASRSFSFYRIFSYPTRFIADQFFACSRDAGVARYGKRVGGDKNRCRVLNNAIDVNRFTFSAEARKACRDDLGIKDDDIVVGNVGRFAYPKNHPFIFEVFEEIKKKNSSAMLLLVGDGELRPQIEEIIEKKNLKESVILTGVRSNTWDYYQAMDVFLMPSVYEGLPVSMVEAQTCGLPCCVSTGVPRESAILEDLVQFYSLEDPAELWAERVLKSVLPQRRDTSEEIKKAGYDITDTAKWLTEYYLDKAKKQKND